MILGLARVIIVERLPNKLEDCLSFCRSYNLLPKSVRCPTYGDELSKLYVIRRKTTKNGRLSFSMQ